MTIPVVQTFSSNIQEKVTASRRILYLPPVRYYVMMMSFLSACFMFAARCVINVAILAMVKPTHLSFDEINLNSTEIVQKKQITATNLAPTFDWSQAQQGVVIGSYFYSYAAVQITTGFLADKFDVIKLSTYGHIFSALCTILIPIAAQTHFSLLIVVRTLMGLVQGPTLPSLYILFEKWFIPQEKAFAQALMTVGCNIGVAIVMPITAWLCVNGFAGGWPSAFYCMGIANIAFAFIWYMTISADPANSRLISDEEKKFIINHVVQIPKRKVKVPWKSMFMSLPLWSVTLARGICSLGYHTINSKIPLYLESILGYSLQGNGLVNSMFYVAEGLGQLISGPVSKYVASAGYVNLTVTRKLFEGIALLGPALFLLSIPLLSGQANIIVLGLILTMFTMGASSGGDVPIVPEMAPGLVGTVFGFANTISCAAGFLAPMTIGYILGEQESSPSRWNISFFFFGGLQILGFIFFALFATSKAQSWALVENTTKTKKIKQQLAFVQPSIEIKTGDKVEPIMVTIDLDENNNQTNPEKTGSTDCNTNNEDSKV